MVWMPSREPSGREPDKGPEAGEAQGSGAQSGRGGRGGAALCEGQLEPKAQASKHLLLASSTPTRLGLCPSPHPQLQGPSKD